MKYPTGVENHGGKLRIWFVYKGVRVRENLGVPDTAKNRRVAGDIVIGRHNIININTLLVRFASAVDGVESPLIIHTGNEL